MSLDWQILGSDAEAPIALLAAAAAWVAAIAAVVAAAAGLLAERRRKIDRKAEMDRKHGELAGCREIFWTALREAYDQFRLADIQAPEQLVGLIFSAGLPTDLVPRKEKDLRLWPVEHARGLDPDQRLLWQFVTQIYPPRGTRTGKVTEFSIISQSDAEQFHNARGELARFWNGWVPSMPMRYLRKQYAGHHDQMIILSWLEIALTQWTDQAGEGKTHLFRLAKAISNA